MAIKKSTFPLLGLAFVVGIAPSQAVASARDTHGASAAAFASLAVQGRNAITGHIFNETGRPM